MSTAPGEPEYAQLLEDVRRALEGEGGVAAAVGLVHDRLPHYSWVGFYRLEGDELVLGPWSGPAMTGHARIPVGEGICGSAARSGATEVVDNVESDDRYLVCFASTRSDVVPVRSGDRVIGELDIDSDLPAAFGEVDRRLLEGVAESIADRERAERHASRSSWLVDEWGRGSFPASDPPSRWAGLDSFAASG